MSTQAKVDRAMSLTRKIVPNFDQKVQQAASSMSIGSASTVQQLMGESIKAMKDKANTPEAQELIRLGTELAQGR